MIIRITKTITLFGSKKHSGDQGIGNIIDMNEEVAQFLIDSGVAELVVKPVEEVVDDIPAEIPDEEGE